MNKPEKQFIIDAENKVVGRIATQTVQLLCGKDDPAYEPNKIPQRSVVVINASKVKISGDKANSKTYKRFSGYPGGLKHVAYRRLYENDPKVIIEHAVRGMLPKNKLRAVCMQNLTVYKKGIHDTNK